MLFSILPPVVNGGYSRMGRARWIGLSTLHSVSTIAAAVVVGSAVAVVARAAHTAFPAVTPGLSTTLAIGVAVGYLPRLLGWTRYPRLLQSRRQVPRRWAVDYPPWLAAILFGIGLGTGFYTRIVVPTFYLLILVPFVRPSVLATAVCWGSYGAARSLNVWWVAFFGSLPTPFDEAAGLTAAITRKSTMMVRANAMLLLLSACFLVARVAIK